MTAIFNAYDLNQNGSIEYEELRELLIDLGHDTMFIDQPNAEEAFEDHVQSTWLEYDLNQDGYISFEEFIPIHSDLIDNWSFHIIHNLKFFSLTKIRKYITRSEIISLLLCKESCQPCSLLFSEIAKPNIWTLHLTWLR